MCSNKKAAFRRPGQYAEIVVDRAFEKNYRKVLLHLYLWRRECRAVFISTLSVFEKPSVGVMLETA
jgi:hypothetical protein